MLASQGSAARAMDTTLAAVLAVALNIAIAGYAALVSGSGLSSGLASVLWAVFGFALNQPLDPGRPEEHGLALHEEHVRAKDARKKEETADEREQQVEGRSDGA